MRLSLLAPATVFGRRIIIITVVVVAIARDNLLEIEYR
jgi:hypothetical protein